MSKKIKERIVRELEGKKNPEDILRENAINLAKHHKKYCEGEDCSVSLYLLRFLLRGKFEINLTEEEEKIFT